MPIASTNANCTVTTKRRHSVASHPHSASNPLSNTTSSSSTTTSSTTCNTKTSTSTSTTNTPIATTTIATISHQRTLSLPLAAAAINQTQPSKRSVKRCMYFPVTIIFFYSSPLRVHRATNKLLCIFANPKEISHFSILQ